MAQLSDDCFAAGEAPMTTEQALALIGERVRATAQRETIALRGAVGRILARPLVARRDVPPHDNAAVDGYAFAFSDLDGEAEATLLTVAGRAAAGHPLAAPVRPGEAARIFTGAAMPAGADTVAMQEDCREAGHGRVAIPRGLSPGANRRSAGEDVATGATVLERGHRLRPQDIGLIAALGVPEIAVHRRLRVALLSTGDEIRDPGDTVAPGCVYDANRYLLLALLEGLGCEVEDLGILADDADAIRDALRAAGGGADLIVSSGGVSVGEEDRIRAAVAELGHLHFWRLAIKPGRPLALGQIGATPFIGLPGNPVAAMVTFLRFARPLVLRLAGASDVAPVLFPVRADFEHGKKKNRREWVRARLVTDAEGGLAARKFARQGAGILSSLVASDGLVELPEDMTRLARGTTVAFLPFNEVTP